MKYWIMLIVMLGWMGVAQGQKVKIKLKEYNQLRDEANALNTFLTEFGMKDADKKNITEKMVKLNELKRQLSNTQNHQTLQTQIKKLTKENSILKDSVTQKDKRLGKMSNKISQLNLVNKNSAKTTNIQNKQLKKQVQRLQKDSVALGKVKRELKTKDASLKTYKGNNNTLNKQVNKQKTEIERLRKIKTKYKAIEKDLKITFIGPVQRFTKSLNYDQARALRLQERSQRLAQVIPKHNVALTTLVKNLGVFRRLSIKIKAYKSILNKPYNKNAQTPGNTATLSLAQKNDLAAYRKAYNEYCEKNQKTSIRVKSARAYIVKYPQKMRTKLNQALAALDKRYGYLRQEINKNRQNLNYECKISGSKCN